MISKQAVLGVIVLVAGSVAVAQVTQSAVRGKLRPTDDESRAKGKFVLVSKDKRGNVQETIAVGAIHLDATRDDEGNRPVYDLWLVDVDENEADFGDLRLNRAGSARFKWSSRRDDYPDGVDALTDFSEGTIQVRDADSNVVLDASIPEFLGLTDDNESGSHAAARAKAKSRLRSDDDTSVAAGAIETRYVNRPSGVRELYTVRLVGLGADGGPYAVVAIDGSTEIDLGDVETAGRAGKGRLHVDTNDEDTIPDDGSVLDLSGLDVEVRDNDDNVVLTGSFPTIE